MRRLFLSIVILCAFGHNVYAIAGTEERAQVKSILRGKWARARNKTAEMKDLYKAVMGAD
jgi:hypothetical protein